MQKKRTLIIIGVVVAGMAVVGVLWHQGFIGHGDRYLRRLVKNQPELLALYDKAKVKEKEIAEKSDSPSLYFDEGLAWKSIAERITGNQEIFFQRSLGVYEDGIAKFGAKNILFYLNAGNLAVHVNDFAKAETYYKKAIAISPGDESGYINLAELYMYRMQKPKEAILAVFADGTQRMFDPTPIIAARASYLRRIGDRSAALVDYETLSKNFPNNVGYKVIIEELKQPAVSP